MALTPVSDAGGALVGGGAGARGALVGGRAGARGALVVGWVEAEVADEEIGLGRGEVLLVLGVRLRHLRFGKPKVTAESASRDVISEAEIFFGNKSVGCLHNCLFYGW